MDLIALSLYLTSQASLRSGRVISPWWNGLLLIIPTRSQNLGLPSLERKWKRCGKLKYITLSPDPLAAPYELSPCLINSIIAIRCCSSIVESSLVVPMGIFLQFQPWDPLMNRRTSLINCQRNKRPSQSEIPMSRLPHGCITNPQPQGPPCGPCWILTTSPSGTLKTWSKKYTEKRRTPTTVLPNKEQRTAMNNPDWDNRQRKEQGKD